MQRRVDQTSAANPEALMIGAQRSKSLRARLSSFAGSTPVSAHTKATQFDASLECGILAHGFLRLRCGDCGHDKLVASLASVEAFARRAAPGVWRSVYLPHRLGPTRRAEGVDGAGADAPGHRLQAIAVRRHQWVQLARSRVAGGLGEKNVFEFSILTKSQINAG